ncbi:GspH/FimT family pseudopilin [Thioalkalivibrio sp. ALE23]|uniref:GspH/FimT family pseudopilin n=1 Tax=Thioalkalivibrio sp. ALE23 TaxID=1265495 RepID=UPI00036BE368|nr:GspH/FimT family pseudopilin [Thioalkalivibrio sp. ALE23]
MTPTAYRPRTRGLTLIELLVALAVFITLSTVGVSSMQTLVDRSRVTATTNQLLTALHFTRSEAVRLNHTVTLCASRDGRTCTGTDWSHGWIAYRNPHHLDQPASAEDILRATSLPAGRGIEIAGNSPVRHYVSYGNAGISRRHSGALQMGTLRLCGRHAGRNLIINAAGRPRTEPAPCPHTPA